MNCRQSTTNGHSAVCTVAPSSGLLPTTPVFSHTDSNMSAGRDVTESVATAEAKGADTSRPECIAGVIRSTSQSKGDATLAASKLNANSTVVPFLSNGTVTLCTSRSKGDVTLSASQTNGTVAVSTSQPKGDVTLAKSVAVPASSATVTRQLP